MSRKNYIEILCSKKTQLDKFACSAKVFNQFHESFSVTKSNCNYAASMSEQTNGNVYRIYT